MKVYNSPFCIYILRQGQVHLCKYSEVFQVIGKRGLGAWMKVYNSPFCIYILRQGQVGHHEGQLGTFLSGIRLMDEVC